MKCRNEFRSFVMCHLHWLYFFHSSYCVFVTASFPIFVFFYCASSTLSVSFFKYSFLLFSPLSLSLFPSVFPDSGLCALYYMLTLLLRLALAIIGHRPSSSSTQTLKQENMRCKKRHRKGRAKSETAKKEGW